MTGPRFTDELAQKERRRDYNAMSMSSRLRARELETTCKQIAAERSQTHCLFRKRKDELLSSMKTRVKQLEKAATTGQQHADVTCQPLSLEARSRATDPYPVSFGRVGQRSRADELLEQYHGRRRKSYEFEDAPLRRAGAHQQQQQQQHGARRLSKEFEDLPSVRPSVRYSERYSERLPSQRRKSREYEDIRLGGRLSPLLSPLLSRRRKSKEFEDVAFGRPSTRRLFAGDRGEAARVTSSDQRRWTPAPPPPAAAPTSPKSPKGAAHKNKFRMTYPVDKITHGMAEFTTIHSSRSRDGDSENGGAAAAAGGALRARRSVTFVKQHEEGETAAAVNDAAAIPAAADAATVATGRESSPSTA